MSHFVEIQRVDREIGDFEEETAIFSAHTEVVREIEINTASVNKCRLGLTSDTVDQESVCRIEDQSSSACQRVRSNAGFVYRNVRHE